MKIIAFILAFFASSVFAQEVWVEVASSNTMTVHGKNVKTMPKGVEMMIRETKGTQIKFYFVQIETATCANQHGKLNFYEINRKPFFATDYVSNGGNIASGIGDWMCLFIQPAKGTTL